MKRLIDDVITLLQNHPRLKNDGEIDYTNVKGVTKKVTAVKIKTFCKFEDDLILEYPAIIVARKSKAPLKDRETMGTITTALNVDIVAFVQDFEGTLTDTNNASYSKGFEGIDLLEEIITDILNEYPKINNSYVESDITNSDYSALPNDDKINFGVTLTLIFLS